MMVPPLSERPVTEEDEEQFRRESMPRKYTLRQRWADYRADAKAKRPKGAKARVRAWLHVEPFYWGMRVTYVVLVVGAVFAVYINAEHAASTCTKPELPEEAKENTERGAELAAEYYHALMGYSWNTGDTSVLLGISDPDSTFATSYADDVAELYSNGWAYGSESEISHIVRVEPIPENGNDVRPNTIAVTFQLSSKTGVLCQGQKIVKRDREYQSLLTLYMTWQDDHWIETQGSLITDASK